MRLSQETEEAVWGWGVVGKRREQGRVGKDIYPRETKDWLLCRAGILSWLVGKWEFIKVQGETLC